jgi:hypothetical protein
MTRDGERRLAALEAAIRGRAERELPDLDVAVALEEWHRLRSEPPAAPRPLSPDIASLSDAEAVDLFRRMVRP